MQDEDIRFMIENAGMNAYKMACRSMLEDGALWRQLVHNGLYEKANATELDRAFFAVVTCKDVDRAREFASAVFERRQCHDSSWLNRFFYCIYPSRSSVKYRLADLACHGADDHQIHPPTLSAVLGLLSERGLDLAVRTPIKMAGPKNAQNTVVDNGLFELVEIAAVSEEARQGALIDVARVYLGLGVTMHESANGIDESPLACLLRCEDPDLMAPWAPMLVDEEHVKHEHVRSCAQLDDVSPGAVALFDAYFARQQIQSIAAAAQSATRAVSP